ncbi:MAG: cytochrome c3 family protein [Nitrospinae bacterium]|nr:cytochrome c3 family protein [Nitrospinota bacterium]
MENESVGSRLTPRSGVAKAFATIGVAAVVGLIIFGGYFYHAPIFTPGKFAPKQPFTYSHKLHAGDLGINCQYCHIYARKAEFAGVPPFSKCMNCHQNLTIDKPSIKEIQKAYDAQNMGNWIRVYNLPDHVWFNHKRHIAKEIECKKCHGAVETMEINAQNQIFRMGFCLDCHQERKVSTDCWTCHT